MSRTGELFLIFCRISLGTIGGGLAMLPWVEQELVARRKWIGREEFLDIFGIAQSMPGVMIVNVATTVGYRIAGATGALAAFAGTVLPPFATILAIAGYFLAVRESSLAQRLFGGIRPAVIALVVIPVISLSRALSRDWYSLAVPALTALAVVGGHVHPAHVILAGCALAAASVFEERRRR